MKTFKQFVTELFDKPWNLEPVESGGFHDNLKSQLSATHPEHTNFRLYRATDDGADRGHIMEFHHDGNVEIHHIDHKFRSGKLTKSTGGPNTKFIATMKSRIHHHVVKNGNRVKVVAAPSMIKQYHSLTQRIGKGQYDVSKITKNDSPLMRKARTFNISPSNEGNKK